MELRKSWRSTGQVKDDKTLHAVETNMSGATALCGAGPIVKRVPGWFDPDRSQACATCAERANARGTRTHD